MPGRPGCHAREVPCHCDPPPERCVSNGNGIIQAPAPAQLIEAGLPTEALPAQIAVSKYADGLPLCRQEGIYARDGVEPERRLMAQWMGRLGFELAILADHLFAEVKKGEGIFADETTHPTLTPGNGAAKKAWLWACARDDRPFRGQAPPWLPVALKTAGPVTVFAAIPAVTAAFSRWTDIAPVPG